MDRCPNCGAEYAPGAAACPRCGAALLPDWFTNGIW